MIVLVWIPRLIGDEGEISSPENFPVAIDTSNHGHWLQSITVVLITCGIVLRHKLFEEL